MKLSRGRRTGTRSRGDAVTEIHRQGGLDSPKGNRARPRATNFSAVSARNRKSQPRLRGSACPSFSGGGIESPDGSKWLSLRCTLKGQNRVQTVQQKVSVSAEFFMTSIRFLLRRSVAGAILLQCGIEDILSAMLLPFLGVSSLNLAAPSGAAFFLYSAACRIAAGRSWETSIAIRSASTPAMRVCTSANLLPRATRSSSR